jgi:hypothetical protein
MEGFAKYSKLFCDSIIFWGLSNGADEQSKGIDTGKHIANIRSVNNQSSLEVESIKSVGSGTLYRENRKFFSREILEQSRRSYDTAYTDGYIAIKVSLAYCRAKRVIPALSSILPTLKELSIALHDIDLARDCRYVTTRMYLERHLKERRVCPIDDRKRVGDHCVSWMGTGEAKNIRYKVYNKFVQMLESAEVRKSLGSRMEDIVATDGRFSKRLLRHKNHGFSRLELTFHGAELLDLSAYQKRVEDAVELLGGCTTFDCSYESQWIQRAQRIISMTAVYFPKKKLFAYCHWWNSVTAKKYGYAWKRVSRNIVNVLLANYSFNDRPIHYIEVEENGGSVSITKERTYKRLDGSTAMTLVPGGSKGMHPSVDSFPTEVRSFDEMGIVEVDNIIIGWPRRRRNNRSAPLAEITEVGDDDDHEYVKKIKRVSASVYTSAHRMLRNDKEYTVVAAGYINYRGEYRWHFVTGCGLRVRAGKSLTKIWDKWRRRFADDSGRMEIEWT